MLTFDPSERWNPPVPLGLPHRVMEDDVYKGHHIPKGATVIANILFVPLSSPSASLPRLKKKNSMPAVRYYRIALSLTCSGRSVICTSPSYLIPGTQSLGSAAGKSVLHHPDPIFPQLTSRVGYAQGGTLPKWACGV